MKLQSEAIRAQFLEFFKDKDHEIVSSASLIPADDPTLMFTNAGMNQFKDVFLATGSRPYHRAADTQKCLRVSGKHNDLEEVGVDTYHHTFFEMLGNWSFGDYFKKEAIRWAWELLVDRWGMDPDRLYATVHEGDAGLGLDADEEAARLWESETGLNPDHIIFAGSKDNFWMMGDTGPCGPCSEVHVDLRPEAERKKVDGKSLVNADDPRVIEIWNLVFIQYNAQGDGTLQPLKAKHVDTGMGFERVTAVLQGSSSTYDTDLFAPIFDRMAALSPRDEIEGYDRIQLTDEAEKEKIRIAMRVVADHIRAIAFTIADGAGPSNTGRGYVVRRILRRAVRYGYQSLAFREPFLFKLIDPLEKKMGDSFPEIAKNRSFIERVIKAEEESFLRTLDTGIDLFQQVVDLLNAVRAGRKDLDVHETHLLARAYTSLDSVEKRLAAFEKDAVNGIIAGDFVFLLQDTYGFPHDLTQLMAREQGLSIDEASYQALMEEQRARARAATMESFRVDHTKADTWQEISQGKSSEFVGYDTLEVPDAAIRSLRVHESGTENAWYEIELDRTPFYAESGGQIGDTGELSNEEEAIRVLDTKKIDGRVAHRVDRLPESLTKPFHASVDPERREKIAKHHTATHLMHAALRKVLGTHVQQKGSLVAPDRLRFDFNHFERVSDDELREIERIVNERIQLNVAKTEERSVPMTEALDRGAMALFGEKYGDQVRVITFDPEYSVELCGGTHVEATGEIGLFRFLSEGSVASGIRRVEAIVGEDAFEMVQNDLAELGRVRELLHNVKENADVEVSRLIQQNRDLEKELARLRQETLSSNLESQLTEFMLGDIRLLTGSIDPTDMNTLRDVATAFRQKLKSGVVTVMGTRDPEEDKVYLVATVSDDLVAKGIQAGKLVGSVARMVGGGGGGKPQLATAGGRNPENLDDALSAVPEILKRLVEG